MLDIRSTSYRPETPSPVDEPFRPSQEALATRRFWEDLMGSCRGEPGMPVNEPKPDVNPVTHGPRDETPIAEARREDKALARRLTGR